MLPRSTASSASCRADWDAQPVVVVSALAEVTDQLLEAGHAAANGHLGFRSRYGAGHLCSA